MVRLRFMLITTALLASASFVAESKDNDCYTDASISGNYALVGVYGANIAIALGVRDFDGKGNVTGTFTINAPDAASTTGARKLITGTQIGTYTVNCDGTGTITRTVSSSTGVVTQQTDDFLITQGRELHEGLMLATALQDMQRTPSALVPGGVFLTRSYTRRPD